MAWSFGDGFDLYSAAGDALNGYWDNGNVSFNFNMGAGRFGGRAITPPAATNAIVLVKSSNVNDSVHHIVVAIQAGGAPVVGGILLGSNFQLMDGATAQCSIVYRNDGSWLLTSGGASGTTLATYTGAVLLPSVWYAFEFEVVIHNTTGSFTVRKNGNTSADFTATGLNTRGGTTNNYANRMQIHSGPSGISTSATVWIDDLFWRSDASSVAWLGDIRCYTRMPSTDVSVQFSKFGTRSVSYGTFSSFGLTANRAGYSLVVAAYSGTFSSVTFQCSAAHTGNLKCSLFNDNGSGAPGIAFQTATNIVAGYATSAFITFNFSPAVSITVGQRIWFGVCTDGGSGTVFNASISSTFGWYGTTTYSTFPNDNPSLVSLSSMNPLTLSFTVIPMNAGVVSEAQQDALTSYVYDTVPGHADFYNIFGIGTVPANVIAVTTRGFVTKSDAGSRTVAVQLKSGATTVATPTGVLTTSNWSWVWRTDVTDPNTSVPWTASAVDALQVGPLVVT